MPDRSERRSRRWRTVKSLVGYADHPISNRHANAGGNTQANGASCRADKCTSQGNPGATSCSEHLRGSGQPLGLQLLRRQRHIKPTEQFLQLFQLHRIVLDDHEWIRRAMC